MILYLIPFVVYGTVAIWKKKKTKIYSPRIVFDLSGDWKCNRIVFFIVYLVFARISNYLLRKKKSIYYSHEIQCNNLLILVYW